MPPGLPLGQPNTMIYDLYATNTALYMLIGTYGTQIEAAVWRWDGTLWQQMGGNLSQEFFHVVMYADTLYIAGEELWVLDDQWQLVHEFNQPVTDLEVGPDGLYIAGHFSATQHVLRWDGTSISNLASMEFKGSNLEYDIDLAVYNRNVYIDDSFMTTGMYLASTIAFWHNPVGPNSVPQTISETLTLGEAQSMFIDLHDYAWDLDYDPLTFSNITVSHGAVINLGNGFVRVMAPFTDTGTPILTYTVQDDHGGLTSGELHFVIEDRATVFFPGLIK